jgi:hypothetical protein
MIGNPPEASGRRNSMSEERFDQEETEDVDAHKHHVRMGTDEPGTDEESDDVEAHRRVRAATDEPGGDDGSDDVEAHLRRNA